MTDVVLGFPVNQSELQSTVRTMAVTDELKSETARVASMLTIDSVQNPAAYVRQTRLVCSRLPMALREAVVGLQSSGDGALLVTDLEVGSLPATPTTPATDATHSTLLAATAALLLSCIVNLVGFRAESSGRICQCIVPTKHDADLQKSTGSEVCLECHTEQAFNLSTRPDFIALGCLRGDPCAATFVLSARTLQTHLPRQAVDLLREPVFYTRVDRSFVDGGTTDDIRGPLAVLCGPHDDPMTTFDKDLMWSNSPEHQSALKMVNAVWDEHRARVILEQGDVLIIDNGRTIHGRSSFRPRWDGGDRWLCRLQGLCNLPATRAPWSEQPIIELSDC